MSSTMRWNQDTSVGVKCLYNSIMIFQCDLDRRDSNYKSFLFYRGVFFIKFYCIEFPIPLNV